MMRRLVLALLLSFPAAAAAQQENACVGCHTSLPGKFGEPVPLWKKSIHAENRVFCNDCHGGDPTDPVNAMSPQRGFRGVPRETDIPGICGRCHVGVMKDYLASRHGAALGKGGPSCVTCHGNHGIVRASLDLINEKSCTRCHPYERAALMKRAMAEVEATIVTQEKQLETLRNQGVETQEMEQSLFAARNRFHTLFHDVEVEKVRLESAAIAADLATTGKAIAAIDKERSDRKKRGAAAIAFSLVAAWVFHLLRKSYGRG